MQSQQIPVISAWTPEDMPDMTNKNVIVTGANGGLGMAITSALVNKGAHVIMACRNSEKGNQAIEMIKSQYPHASLSLELVDFNDLGSVNDFAARIINQGKNIDVLFNNAGVIDVPLTVGEDNLDLTFKTNYLSHVLLTERLLSVMSRGSRIVFTGSTHHQYGKIDMDDLQSLLNHCDRIPYNNSKFMLLTYCMDLHRRLSKENTGIISIAAHPGFSATNILTSTTDKQTGYLQYFLFAAITKLVGQDPAVGSIPLLYAATSPEAKSGEYYGPGGRAEYSGPLTLTRCVDAVYNEKEAEELRHVTRQVINSVMDNNKHKFRA